MAPGNKPGMNGAAGFQKGLCCESCHSEYQILATALTLTFSPVMQNSFRLVLHYIKAGIYLHSAAAAQSPQWYAWGPPNMQCRLCASCWIYWKKYGGLKTPTQLEGATRAGSVCHVCRYYSNFMCNPILFLTMTSHPVIGCTLT